MKKREQKLSDKRENEIISYTYKITKRMKSIKEKAEEWADMYPSCGMADKSFTKGANYVLEEIENVINSNRILGHPFPSLEMRYNQIIRVIEQLKK